jgi:GrpB-like predicted nucleotidyltransferase (UPF0157 family)/N-acetylglutamate synthase-like GNAT family acetyltransferase
VTFKQNWEKTDQHYQLPEKAVNAMAKLAFPNKILSKYHIISGGCANLNIKINFADDITSYVLRIYIRDQDAVYREQKLSQLLNKQIPIPTIFYVGDYQNYRFAIVEFIPGITLRELLLSAQSYNMHEIMYEVGIIAAKIASYKFPKAGFFDKDLNIIKILNPNDYLEFIGESLRSSTVVDLLDTEKISQIKVYFDKYGYLLSNNEHNLVHSDFDPANILVNQVNSKWKIFGILDWEFAFSGSIMCDIANMLRYSHQMPTAFRQSFLEAIEKSGIELPDNWFIIIYLLNLLSLLDCLARANPKTRPNQCKDILNLISHFIKKLAEAKLTKQIKVVPYDPKWPKIFEAEATLIKQVLGKNLLEIHHVGSTSVKGLIAKPRIDIIAVIKDREQAITALETINYQYKGEFNIPLKLGFTKRLDYEFNLHVHEENNSETELNILFRDYLRNNLDALQEYAALKTELLTKKASFEKYFSFFTGYNLGKDAFIRKILQKAGFNGLGLRHCIHHIEWEEYHRIREKQNFKPIGVIYDRNHPSISAKNHYHLVLYKGIQIIGAAHIELLNYTEAALRTFAIDEAYQNQNYGKYMMQLLEKWAKYQGRSILKMHARLNVENFYRKLGYIDIEFNDLSILKEYVDLGKIL